MTDIARRDLNAHPEHTTYLQRLDAIADLHRPDNGRCHHCGHPFPCPTRRLADGMTQREPSTPPATAAQTNPRRCHDCGHPANQHIRVNMGEPSHRCTGHEDPWGDVPCQCTWTPSTPQRIRIRPRQGQRQTAAAHDEIHTHIRNTFNNAIDRYAEQAARSIRIPEVHITPPDPTQILSALQQATRTLRINNLGNSA